jgi:hypothetical protein
MNSCILFRRLDVLFITAGIALFFFGSAQPTDAGWLQEQQTSPAQQQASQPQQNPQPAPQIQDPSAPKPKKVWSNDDVVSLRTPADIYQAGKEAQQAADAEATAKKSELAKHSKGDGLTIKFPSTPGETEALIKDKEERIKDLRERLDRSNQDLPDAEGSKKTAIQLQIEALSSDLTKTQLEVKALKNHLEELAEGTAGESGSAPVTPPAPQDPQ